MELEASLELLDLDENATLDEAKQAYLRVQHLIAQYYQDIGDPDADIRQADLEILSRAYDRVLAHLSEKTENPNARPKLRVVRDMPGPDPLAAGSPLPDALPAASFSPILPESGLQTVEAALAVIARRLHETEAALPEARQMVNTAAADADAASQRHEQIRQESISAIVAAKSAKVRAFLLEMEVKQAMEKAVAVAGKARKRVEAAKQMAMAAKLEADKAHEQVSQLKKSEEMAIAETMKAEKKLEQARTHLKTLIHDLTETRNRMKLSHGGLETDGDGKTGDRNLDALFSELSSMDTPPNHGIDGFMPPSTGSGDVPDRGGAFAVDVPAPVTLPTHPEHVSVLPPSGAERRRMARIVYPPHACPVLLMEDGAFLVMDLSGAGMRLERPRAEGAFPCPRIVRGTLNFQNRLQVEVTGKVVRESESAVGVRLATHISNTLLAEERNRLGI